MDRIKLGRHALFILFLLLALAIYCMRLFSSFNYLLQDLFLQFPATPKDHIYAVELLPEKPLGFEDWKKWSREITIQLIDKLNQDPQNRPAVIGLDIPLYSLSDDAADKRLSSTLSSADNIVLASQVHFNQQVMRSADNHFFLNGLNNGMLLLPVFSTQANVPHGFTNFFLDSDGRMRRAVLKTEAGNSGETMQFSYVVYENYLKHTGNQKPVPPPIDKNGMWNVGFSGYAGEFCHGLTYQDILNGKAPPMKNAVVLIGATSPGEFTAARTPLSRGTPVCATEIHADMVQALCTGDYYSIVPVWVQCILLVLALCACRYFYWRSIVSAAATLGICTIGYWGLLFGFYKLFGLMLDALYLPLLAIVLYLFRVVSDFLEEFMLRVHTRQTLKRYLAPDTAKQILRHHIKLTPEKRNIAVLFVDIRGFTPLSESLSPDQIAEMLQTYLTLTSSAIWGNGGTVDKFIGDATMGFFNAPLDLDDYVYRAVKAAMEITAGGERLHKEFEERYGRNIRFGVGVHFGEAVVGNVGPTYRKDYTAIGNTVNTASRLESNASPGQVLVSLKVCEALEGRLKASFVGERAIKGKSKPMLLYQVDSLDGICPDGSAATDSTDGQGLSDFLL